jgi:hypothetical protein
MRASVALRILGCVAAVAILITAGSSPAATHHAADKHKAAAKYPAIDLFDGIQAGKLQVRYIPKNVSEAQMWITNKSDAPLSVKVPEAFAAVPVLAQMFPAIGQQRQGQGQAPGQGIPGFPGPGMDQMGPTAPQREGATPDKKDKKKLPGMLDILPEAVAKMKLETLCLDHGKPDPRAAIPYEVRPIGKVSDKPELPRILEMLGRGEISHKAAQVAAWHLVDGMSWEKLAALHERTTAGSIPRYSRQDLDAAKKALAKAAESVKARPAPSKAD